jgi:PAS domain S-box-containing protein
MFLTDSACTGPQGAVEALMARHDWRVSSCGVPAGWEPALQHAVRQMLDSAVPMFIVWGEAETFLYNDAYIPILGRRHPDALGRGFAQVWPEAYAAVTPAVAQVMAGRPASFSHAPFIVTRNGIEEQAWFSFTYSPLRRLDGTVCGFACVVAETTDIDAWKRSDAALQDARLRLEGALGAAEVGTWNWNIRENSLYADANLARLFGVSAQEAEGGPVEAFLAAILPDDVERVQARIAQALDTGAPFSDSYRVRCADGGYRHVEARGKVSFGADGQPEWLPGVAIDVSAQKEAEASLQRSEARFRRLAESNVLGIAHYHADGTLLDPNDAFLDILQVSRKDFERGGLSWRTLTPPEWIAANERGLAQLRATGVMEPFEKEFLRPDGSRVAVYIGAANYEDSSDAGIAWMLDISNIRAAERALKESEARFRVIANAMPQAVWSTRPDGFHDYYNDQWYAFTGMPHGSTDGDGWNAIFHPDDQPAAWEKWRHSLRTGDPYEIEYRLRHHSGQYRWVLGRALPVRADDGKIVRWMGTCTDIHEQKLAQEALKEADRRKDEFLAMLAHELRNPLAPIATAASLLSMAAQDPARVHQVGAVISRQAAHMTGLIDDLMDVSRVTRGLVTLDRQTLPLSQVIEDAVEQVRPQIDARGHRLELQLATGAALIHGDRKRLVQVLANILGNAARYTPVGGHIVLAARIEGASALLEVRDNGIGMAPELVANAFELFHQGRRSADRAQGGLGIGLALVRSLVEFHGGTVAAASAGEGHGSSFTVALPLPVQEGMAQSAAAHGALAAAPAALRVLVVDDNTDAAELVAMFLGLLGYEVSVEFGALAGLERARRLMPHVCLLDIGLPGMDGNELARRLRRMPGLEQVKLAAMTGYGQPHDRRETEAAGFDVHFVKPVETDALAAWLAAVQAPAA